MSKLPKEIYVPEESDEPVFFTNPEECADPDKPVTLAVYKLVGTVEVSTEVKTEIVVKKSPARKIPKKTRKPVTAEIADGTQTDARPALINEMRVTVGKPLETSVA